MPHINVKLFPGRTDEQKHELTERFADAMKELLGTSDAGISMAFEEVPQGDWEARVYKPEIEAKEHLLYKKPGYVMIDGELKYL